MEAGRKVWLAAGTVVLIAMAIVLSGCGGGGASTQNAAQQENISACVDGTVASYLGTTCSQHPAVMHWTSYNCTSVPSSLCAALGTNGANIRMKMDPNGHHTILVTSSGLWN